MPGDPSVSARAARWLAAWRAAAGSGPGIELQWCGEGALDSAYAVTDLASASVAAAGVALAEWVARTGGRAALPVRVDRRLASMWFSASLRPQGWTLPPVWDPVAGDYLAADGWVRLHTNASHHRAACLAVLGLPDVAATGREQVAGRVRGWTAAALEEAVVRAGGCAAEMRSEEAWRRHPQGRAVAEEPLVHLERTEAAPLPLRLRSGGGPLAGIRVLDLTRVLAGPVATRFLAGCGADVLRIDPPGWDESVVPEVTLGKRCARIDLRDPPQRAVFERLLAQADILVHGFRPDALERLGLGAERRRALAPGLVDVALDAYGWTGPWAGRRGFDSLVQMSCGIADRGMRDAAAPRPRPLPVQALDHATGCFAAAAALRGLVLRNADGRGSRWRLSLARTAALLQDGTPGDPGAGLSEETEWDLAEDVENTGWGPARRLRPPVAVEGAPLRWDRPAGPLGTATATFE